MPGLIARYCVRKTANTLVTTFIALLLQSSAQDRAANYIVLLKTILYYLYNLKTTPLTVQLMKLRQSRKLTALPFEKYTNAVKYSHINLKYL